MGSTRGKWMVPALAVLLCAHCSLTLFVAVFGILLAGATVPLVFGVRADMLLAPLLAATLFTAWLWWGRRAAAADEACEVR